MEQDTLSSTNFETDLSLQEMASELVSSALQSLPNNGFLWQRLGCIRWYSGDLIGSYSALTTALNEGEERSRVIHARGQVLAEMGKYQLAIVELNEALTTQRSAHSAAYLRSARAYEANTSVIWGSAKAHLSIYPWRNIWIKPKLIWVMLSTNALRAH